MHCLFFVTFDKSKAKTSEDARRYVLNNIDGEGVSTDGKFVVRRGDFGLIVNSVHIGGRWSGVLREREFVPATRDAYKLLGYQDDAVILTSGLYRRWLEPIESGSARGTHVSLEGENLCRYFIDQKWLVVVDGHLTDAEILWEIENPGVSWR